MVRKSYGKMRGTRKKLKKKNKLSINRYLAEFKKGDKVHIKINPSTKFQHPKFNGKTGTILEKRGNAYIVEVRDMQASKKIFLTPEHLKKQAKKMPIKES